MRSGKSIPRAALVVTLALFVNGCQGRQQPTANGLTPVRLQLDWYPQPEHGGFYAAQSLGYYKAEGLDVTILPLPQYGSVAQLVSTGKADFGLGSSDQILEWDSNGLPLLAVAATMQHDPQAVMVHKDSSIRTFNDLEGHTIAAQTGATWLKYVTSRYRLHQVREIPSTLSIASSNSSSAASTCTTSVKSRRRFPSPTFWPTPATCSRYSSPASHSSPGKQALTCGPC